MMTSVDSNFNFLYGRPHGAWPLPPSTCVYLCLTPLTPPCGHHKWMSPMYTCLISIFRNLTQVLGDRQFTHPLISARKNQCNALLYEAFPIVSEEEDFGRGVSFLRFKIFVKRLAENHRPNTSFTMLAHNFKPSVSLTSRELTGTL